MSPLLRALLAALACAILFAPSAGAQQPGVSLPDIEDELMCPICGTALNLSESPQADRERDFIRRRIAEGQSKQEIKDALVVEYGPEVLASPETSGFDLAAWIVPGLGILVAAIALAVGIRRWRRRGEDGDEAPPGGETSGQDPEIERRLQADLDRYAL